MVLGLRRCRTPRGVRELKPNSPRTSIGRTRSRTPRGVRELKLLAYVFARLRACRTPRGVRELKRRNETNDTTDGCRTPRGVRELKHSTPSRVVEGRGVAPLAGCVN